MQFNQPYNRNEFLGFLRTGFLPEDFTQKETSVNHRIPFRYTQQVTRLGECESLGLVVYEVKHSSKHDARVGLTKEAFRLLADEFCERALIFFVPQDDNSNYRFSLIEITLEQKADSAKVGRKYSNPHRYSYYLGKDIAYYTPNKYLNEAGRVVDIDDLRGRFSVEVLTKAFYQELSDWYAWAVKIVRFPNDLKTEADNEKYNAEAMIRLITRLIFVWFIKQRHLVPNEFFDEKYIADNLIKGFTPNAKVNLFGKSEKSHYYKGILQNLFFAMLNSPITPEGKNTISERRFRTDRSDYDNNKLMRHKDLFINPDLFVELANKYVPFLNGGLFDCLDDKDNKKYFDAFTDREAISEQLVVPDYLFFGEDVGRNIDLSEWYGDAKKKKVSARGIIDILKRYNFTVEENTPFDQEVSLDPELLGKVFENLLASYSPETQTTARKQTGSFYTPREIVQYMVDESLVAHLKRTVGDDLEPAFRQLMQYNDIEPDLTAEQKKAIMQSLYNCKVLDPACGSGAFPMGMLQQMVHILNRIDPDNKMWKEVMINNAISETSEAYQNASDEERAEMVADIERSFNESINRPDYARKLYLIENCIYGVDIQPIAIQISKLRFFISLVVDQKTNNNPVDNFGIRPLPNLEAKFVAANTLIGLEKKEANLFDSDAIREKEKALKEAKHRIFGAKTVKTKRKYKERVATLRTEIADMLKEFGSIGNAEAQQLSSWDMFDQNATSPFFDLEWMFGVGNGFDIVIGNPPYINVENLDEKTKDYLFTHYFTCQGRTDIYIGFIEKAISLLNNKGMTSFIIPYSYTNQNYGELSRKMLAEKHSICEIVDTSNYYVFENAVVKNIIIRFGKSKGDYTLIRIAENRECFEKANFGDRKLQTRSFLQLKNCRIETKPFENILGIKEDIEKVSIRLGKLYLVAYGVRVNNKFDKSKPKSHYIYDVPQSHYKKFTEGKCIDRYSFGQFGWLNYCPDEHYNPMFPELFENEKLMFINVVSKGLRFAYDNEGFYNSHTVVNCVNLSKLTKSNHTTAQKAIKEGDVVLARNYSTKYVLGVINSKLINWYFMQFQSEGLHCYPDDAKQFPIAKASIEQQKPIIDLVDLILEKKRVNPNADTTSLESEIDHLVYQLYGLTDEEIKVVEGK